MTFESFLENLDINTLPKATPIAYGGDLTPETLLSAYKKGVFPWYEEESPILWWSPDPRFILYPKDIIISDTLTRELKKKKWTVTFDKKFSYVIQQCASSKRKDQDGTWITNEMVEAYKKLHSQGHAHSVECWVDGKVVGGLYGVSIGHIFFGESMFYEITNASKVAFIYLVKQLEAWGFSMIDCQVPTDHLASLGAKEISRKVFLKELRKLINYKTKKGIWEFDPDFSLNF